MFAGLWAVLLVFTYSGPHYQWERVLAPLLTAAIALLGTVVWRRARRQGLRHIHLHAPRVR